MQEVDRTAREIRLAAVPDGLPEPADLAIAEAPVPAPGRDEVLVRNRYFTVFAALRTLLGGGAQGTPLPGLHPGDTLFGPAIGEVMVAPEGSGLRTGDLVQHMLGWREYAAVPLARCRAVSGALPPYGGPGACATPTGVVQRRIAALDTEIARLTALRDQLATRIGAEPTSAAPMAQARGRRSVPGMSDPARVE